MSPIKERKDTGSGKKLKDLFPPVKIERRNLLLYLLGLGILIIGYGLLSQGPWDNPLSLTVAPLVLLIGYVVIIPLAILWVQTPKLEEKRRKSGEGKGD